MFNKVKFNKSPFSLLNACILFLYPLNCAFSQEVSDSTKIRTIPLEEVVVQASRGEIKAGNLPASISILPLARIQGAQATLSLEESLRYIPGVFVNNRFNFSQGDRISIRGIGSRSQFGVRGIKMILDDIPLTFADGQSQTNNIDMASLGKIEVLKGPGSVLYGNSSGGVIYMTSEDAPNHKLTIKPSFLAGSFGLQKYQIKTAGTINKFKYLINGDRTFSNGFRDFSTSLFYNLNSLLKYSLTQNSELSYTLNLNDSPYLLNPGSLDKKTATNDPSFSRKFNQLQGSGKTVFQLQSGLGYKLKFKNNSINISGYGVSRDLYNPIPGRIVEVNRQAGGFRSVFQKNITKEHFLITFNTGIDLEYQKDLRKESTNNGIKEDVFPTLSAKDIVKKAEKGPLLLQQDEIIIGSGFFAKTEVSIKKLIISLGARYNDYTFKVNDKFKEDNSDDSGSKNLSKLNPSLGLLFKHSTELNFYVNYSSAFQTPSANEFGNLPSGVGGFNKDLKPERLKTLEAGIRGMLLDKKVTYDFTAFYMEIYDQLIGYQTADTTSSEIFYRNAGKTKNLGLEGLVSFRLLSNLTFDLGGTVNDFRFIDYKVQSARKDYQLKDNKIPGVPSYRFFGALRYNHKSGLSAEINVQQIDKYFGNDFNGTVISGSGNQADFVNDGYTQLDFRCSYERKLGPTFPKIYGGINNILNQRYNSSIVPNATGNRFFEPAPGTNWYVGLSFPITVLK